MNKREKAIKPDFHCNLVDYAKQRKVVERKRSCKQSPNKEKFCEMEEW
jgi:hypothetical protein